MKFGLIRSDVAILRKFPACVGQSCACVGQCDKWSIRPSSVDPAQKGCVTAVVTDKW